jgi:hypothetical protein
MEAVVAILLSAAALAVSLASLYSTSLRGAEIGIDAVLIGGELGTGGAMNNIPYDQRLRVCILISNTGAHGGLLEDVRYGGFEYLGDEPKLWEGLEPTIFTSSPDWSGYSGGVARELHLALEAGDVKTRYLMAPWRASADEGKYPQAQAPVRAYAERLRGLRGVRVDIEWTYRRVTGGWRSLRPGHSGRQRETKTDRTTVDIPPDDWIETCRTLWRENPSGAIDVLDGRDPDAELES